MTLKQISKSRTIDTNLIAGALVTILTFSGLKIPIEVITSFFVLVNIALRMITIKPLNEK